MWVHVRSSHLGTSTSLTGVFGTSVGSWVAVELNGTRLPSTSNPAELGALLPLLSGVSKLLIGMELMSLTHTPEHSNPKNHKHNTHQSKTEQPKFDMEKKPRIWRGAPRLGQDALEILTKLLGYSPNEVEQLKNSDVICC